jgi:MFS family permease
VPLVRLAGRARLIAVSASVAAAAVAALTLTGNPVVLGGLMLVAGYGLGFGQPLTMTLVVQRVPRQWAATALAVRLTGNRLGQVAAPALAGALAGGLGVLSVFWLLGAMLLGSAFAVQRVDVE